MVTGSPRKAEVALVALFFAGCGSASLDSTGASAPAFVVHETGVVVSSDAPFVLSSDLPSRLESTVSAALSYWGGSWNDLAGTTISLEGTRYVACLGTSDAVGCYDGSVRVSTSDAGTPFDCVEQTSLVHEIGHAVIGDPNHTDPRWMDFDAVAAALGGRRGYRHNSVDACQIAVSVWRHPPSAH
jgi:hypothetical protein